MVSFTRKKYILQSPSYTQHWTSLNIKIQQCLLGRNKRKKNEWSPPNFLQMLIITFLVILIYCIPFMPTNKDIWCFLLLNQLHYLPLGDRFINHTRLQQRLTTLDYVSRVAASFMMCSLESETSIAFSCPRAWMWALTHSHSNNYLHHLYHHHCTSVLYAHYNL